MPLSHIVVHNPWVYYFPVPLIERMSLHLVRFPTSTGHMVMVAVAGLRDTKSSPDTLKKLTKGMPGFWQVLPTRCVASLSHLEWAVLHVLESRASHSARYRNPELALLSQVAADPQWEKALEIAGLKPSDSEVVVVWFGNENESDSVRFQKIIKEWGLITKPVSWGKSIPVPSSWLGSRESFALETSALTEFR